ncbi:MAG: hypothetical protein ACTSQI_17680 [Candidatus Helarchaeota archaeon]
MPEEKNIKKNIQILEELAKEGKTINIKICPQCKAVGLCNMDVVGLYAPLSPTKFVCKKCGWVGRAAIEMTNRRIDELDEAILEDIIENLSEIAEK